MIHLVYSLVFACNFRVKSKDKSDRATAEQVMDQRTRMILFKLLSRGVLTQINGCISTGKEANVYHASGQDGRHLAVKVGMVVGELGF